MALIKCRTLHNGEKYVPAETMIHRPSVYGVVIHDHQVLVAQASYTGKYVLPGGGIEKGEKIEAALVREVKEETSIDVTVGPFLHFQTDFFYYDPLDIAFHGFLFYYACTPLNTVLTKPSYEHDEGLDRPLWVDLDTLTADAFQAHGQMALDLITRAG